MPRAPAVPDCSVLAYTATPSSAHERTVLGVRISTDAEACIAERPAARRTVVRDLQERRTRVAALGVPQIEMRVEVDDADACAVCLLARWPPARKTAQRHLVPAAQDERKASGRQLSRRARSACCAVSSASPLQTTSPASASCVHSCSGILRNAWRMAPGPRLRRRELDCARRRHRRQSPAAPVPASVSRAPAASPGASAGRAAPPTRRRGPARRTCRFRWHHAPSEQTGRDSRRSAAPPLPVPRAAISGASMRSTS